MQQLIYCINIMAMSFPRWRKGPDAQHLKCDAPISQSVVTMGTTNLELNRGQRFNACMTVFKEMASFIADKPARQFDKYMECITAFQSQIYADNVATVSAFLLSAVSDDTVVDSIPVSVTDTNQNTELEQLQGTDLNNNCGTETSVLALEVECEEFDEQNQTQAEVEVDMQLVLRPAPKVRGRPAQIRQRPFKVFGARINRATKKENDNQTQVDKMKEADGDVINVRNISKVKKAKRTATCKTETSREDPAASKSVLTAPTQRTGGSMTKKQQKVSAMYCHFGNDGVTKTVPPDNRCVECGLQDPPKNINSSATVVWIVCSVCTYWYHVCCVSKKMLPKKKAGQYTCKRCVHHAGKKSVPLKKVANLP